MKSPDLEFLDDVELLERVVEPSQEELEELERAREMAQSIQADDTTVRSLLDLGQAQAQATAGLLQRQGGNQLVGRLLRGGAPRIRSMEGNLRRFASSTALKRPSGPRDPQLALREARQRARALLDRGLSQEVPPALQLAEDPEERLDRVRSEVSGVLGVDPTQEMDAVRERLATEVTQRDLRLQRETLANEAAEAAEEAEAAAAAELSEARTVGSDKDPAPAQEGGERTTQPPIVHEGADPARLEETPAEEPPDRVEAQEKTPEQEGERGEEDLASSLEDPQQELDAETEAPSEEEQAALDETLQQARALEEETAALEAEVPAAPGSELEGQAPLDMTFQSSETETLEVQTDVAGLEAMASPEFVQGPPPSDALAQQSTGQTGGVTSEPVSTTASPGGEAAQIAPQGFDDDGSPSAPDLPDAAAGATGAEELALPSVAGQELDLAQPPALPTLDQLPTGSADTVAMPPVPVVLPPATDELKSGTTGQKLADEQGPAKDAAQLEAEAQIVGEEGKKKLAAAEAELQAQALQEAQTQVSQASSARDQEITTALEAGDAQVGEAHQTAIEERAEAKNEGDDRAASAVTEGQERDELHRSEHQAEVDAAQRVQDRELGVLERQEEAEIAAEEAAGDETLATLETQGELEQRAIEAEGSREEEMAHGWAQRAESEIRAAGAAERRQIRADAKARAEADLREADARANARVAEAELTADRRLAEAEKEKRRLEEEARQFKKSQPWYKRAWSWVKDKANALKDMGKALWNQAKALATAAVNKALAAGRVIREVAKRTVGAIYRAADKATGGVLTRVANKVKAIGSKLGQKLKQIGQAVVERISAAAAAVRKRISAAIRATRDAVQAIGRKIVSAARAVRDVCVGAIQAAGRALANALKATARFVRDRTLQAVSFVQRTYTRIAEVTQKVVGEIVREVTTRVKRAWEVASTAIVSAATWLGDKIDRFTKWAQEAFVKFWTGPWRDILLGIGIAVMIAAITVATGGAGLVLIVGISAATGAVLRAGGEIAARRAAVAIKNDPERAVRFASEMADGDAHAARWYEGVSKDEGWGTTLKHGGVEGVKGAIEGAVIGVSGAGAGMVGTRIAATMAKSAAKKGAMTLGRRAAIKSAEWSARSSVDFAMGLSGDVAAGHALVEIDVAMGYRTRDEAYHYHVGRYLSTEALGARFVGSKIGGGLRMGSHLGVERTVQDRLVNAVTRSSSMTNRTVTQQVTRQVVDMSVGGAESGTTAGLMSVANGGTFQEGFSMGFVGGVGGHAGRLGGESYVRRGGLGTVSSVSADMKMKQAGLDPRREGAWRASGPTDRVEVEVEGGGGGQRQSVNADGPRKVPTPTELNVHQAKRLQRLLPGQVEGIPKGTKIVPDGAPGPLPPGAMRVSEARHYIKAVRQLRLTPTGREALTRMDQKGVKVTTERGGSYMRGAQLNVDLESRTPQDVANVMVHESHHAATRTELPDVRRTSRKQFVDGMLRNESEAQARLLEHGRESGQTNNREFGYEPYHQAYDQTWSRLKNARPDLSAEQRHSRSMEAGTVALEKVFAEAVPSTSLTLDANSGRKVLRSGAPQNYEEHYGRYWDRTTNSEGPKKPLPEGGTKKRVADKRQQADPEIFAAKRPLEASLEDLLASPEAQGRLYKMAQNGLAEAQPKIAEITSKYKGAEGVVLLKRTGRGAFIEAVSEKYQRKAGKYDRVGDVGDMVRGRINLAGGASLDGLLADVQAAFPRSTIDAKTDGPYPRVHVDIELENGVRFELQVGTHATTRFLETSMVELPSALHSKVGRTEGNFHVAKYDILDKVTQPAMRQRYGLDAFDARYDKALKSTGSGIYDVEGTRALREDMAAILRRIEADDPAYLQSLYTKGSKESTAPKQSAPSELDMDGLERMPMPDQDDVVRRSKPEVDVSEDPNPVTLHDGDGGKKKEHKPHYATMGEDVFKKPPSVDDVNQGYLADCYLIAGMGALAKQRPELVQRMITDHGDGTVTVELHTNKNGYFAWPDTDGASVHRIRITKELPTINGKTPTYAKGADGQLWPGLVEKAYAIHMAESNYQGLNTGGSVGRAMEVLAGGRSKAIATQYEDSDVLLSRLDASLQEKKPLAAGSMDKDALKTDAELKALADEKTVYPWHAYVITDVDVKNNEVRLYNPWGSRHPKPMTIQEFQRLYRTVYVGNPESAPMTMPAPDTDHVGTRGADLNRGSSHGTTQRSDVANTRVEYEGGVAQSQLAGEGYKKIISGIDGELINEHSWVTHGHHSLDEEVAATFSGGRYARMILNRPLTLYRAWHPETSREFGGFWSMEKPRGSLQTRIDSALLPRWARSRSERAISDDKEAVYSVPNPKQASHYTVVEVPAGTIIHVGEVSNQGDGYVGGGSQVLVTGGVKEEWKVGGGELD